MRYLWDALLVYLLLREIMCHIQHYSYRTEQTYLDWIRRFLLYVGSVKDGESAGEGMQPTRRPVGRPRDADQSDGLSERVQITQPLIKDYLAWLATQRQVASSTQNQAFNALLFMARGALKLDLDDMSKGLRAKTGKKLPVALSPDETKRLLAAVNGTQGLILGLMYGGGLRLTELCRLRTKDIDFDNELIFVRSGKGKKDRSTLLAASVIPALRGHIEKLRELHEQDLVAGGLKSFCRMLWLANTRTRRRSSVGTGYSPAPSHHWTPARGRCGVIM